MKNDLSHYAKRLTGQPMFQLSQRIKEINHPAGFTRFEIGDPDFNVPESIKQATISALNIGYTHYTNSSGMDELKESIAMFTARFGCGFIPELNQIAIAPGCNPLIYCIIKCLVRSCEYVAIPDPSFPTYHSVLNFLNLGVVSLPLREENNFNVAPQDLEDLADNVKLVIINSPNNPTGSMISSLKDAAEIASICERKGIYILSDEIYNLMVYDKAECFSPCQIDQCRKRTIIINGFSKSFAMSGFRLGYMIGPDWLVEKVGLLLQTIVSCTSEFIQYAGIEAYDRIPVEISQNLKTLQGRRDILCSGLNMLPGVKCRKPPATFYLWADIRDTKMTSQEFADKMFKGFVALLPGTDFGPNGEGYVRLAFTLSGIEINVGLKRMECVLTGRKDSIIEFKGLNKEDVQ